MVAPWITIEELADPTSTYADDAVEAASFVLFYLSGRKYGGVASTTEVYCQIGLNQLGTSAYYGLAGHPQLPGPSGYQIAYPELQYGQIINRVGGACSACGCPHLIRLRGAPILSVESVYDEDREIPLSEVAIYDYRYISTGPRQCWRTCGELEISYTYGSPPPVLGKIAAKALADQYLLAMAGDDECALPQRITQISRQGESWTLLDPQTFLEKGRTGIYQVDLFLTTVNPDGARLRARVFSPDLHRGLSFRWADKTGPVVTPVAAPVSAPAPVQMSFSTLQATPAPDPAVTVYAGRPLRWIVPGSFTAENPPSVVVRPSGEQMPPDALKWRTNNFTLDLSGSEVDRLLLPGSVLVVATTATDGSTLGEVGYPVERRTL